MGKFVLRPFGSCECSKRQRASDSAFENDKAQCVSTDHTADIRRLVLTKSPRHV